MIYHAIRTYNAASDRFEISGGCISIIWNSCKGNYNNRSTAHHITPKSHDLEHISTQAGGKKTKLAVRIFHIHFLRLPNALFTLRMSRLYEIWL